MSTTILTRLSAFANGISLPIEAVPDPVFAGCMLGDGVAIDPSNGALYAPCDAEVLQVHAAQHACILQLASGARILLHIGIDTVLLKGEGFSPKVKAGDFVQSGQVLIEFDKIVLERHEKPVIIVLVIENGDEFCIPWRAEPAQVVVGDALLDVAPAAATSPPITDCSGDSSEDEIATGWAVVRHAGGMHARPCALLAHALKPFLATVTIEAHGKSANARSATAMMGLALAEGDEVAISTSGKNAGDALEAAMLALETPSAAHEAAAPAAAPQDTNLRSALLPHQLLGVVASPGLVSGLTVRFAQSVGEINELGAGENFERQALSTALKAVVDDIEAAVSEAKRRGMQEQAEVFSAHQVLAEDPETLSAVHALISSGKSAAFAWQGVTEVQCAALLATQNALLAGRVSDLRDLAQRVVGKLTGVVRQAPDFPPHAVLLADDLLPSDFSLLERAGVTAIVTALGGPTSHIAILARAHGIPTLVAVGPSLAKVALGTMVIVDADAGFLDTAPTPEQLAAAAEKMAQRDLSHAAALAEAHKNASTTDGTRIEVAANISTEADAQEALKLGAESVGLLRTELLFVDRQTAPSEAEQRTMYQAILQALEGRSVIFRTLDVGADKTLPYLPVPVEENPALGLRGIRLSWSREDLLCEQLRAILALQPRSAVRILLPMVVDLAEIVATRALIERLAKEMGNEEKIELGVMIETPSAAVLADQLAQEADFFSVGTNDLTQYTLCMDRTNSALASRVDGFHPAVLRLIALTAQGASKHAKWLGVCGAMASDPLAVPVLIGLGVRELSVSPAVIPEIKALIRKISLADCQSAVQTALQQTSAEAVRASIKARWPWLAAL